MVIELHHNFSGLDLTQEIDHVYVRGNYYSFTLDLGQDKPFGEYSYKLKEKADSEEILSSGIINYSPYVRNSYVVKNKVTYVIYDQNK